MRSAEQARGVLGALELRLSDEEAGEIEGFREKAMSAWENLLGLFNRGGAREFFRRLPGFARSLVGQS